MTHIKETVSKVKTDVSGKWVSIEEVEKLSRLLIKECTDVVADAVDHREPASTYVGKIKKHFGVIE